MTQDIARDFLDVLGDHVGAASEEGNSPGGLGKGECAAGRRAEAGEGGEIAKAWWEAPLGMATQAQELRDRTLATIVAAVQALRGHG